MCMARFRMDGDSLGTFVMLLPILGICITGAWNHSLIVMVGGILGVLVLAKALWNRGLGNGMDYVSKTGIYGE